MKTLLVSVPVLSILLLSGSFASAIEIVDEGQVFNELAGYTAGAQFEDVLKCGQMFNFGASEGVCQFNCNTSFCMSTCSEPTPKKFAVAVEDCSADKANVYGENGMSLSVAREDFKKGGNTLIIPFLQDIGRYVKPAGSRIVLTRVFPKFVSMIENGNKTSAMGYDVSVEIDYGPGMQRPQISLLIVPAFNDIRSLARFGQMPSDFYRFKGIVDDEGF